MKQIIIICLAVCFNFVGCYSEKYNQILREERAFNEESREFWKQAELNLKRAKVLEKKRNEQFDKISVEFLKLGMTQAEVTSLCGDPKDVNRSVGTYGIHEQWIYTRYEGFSFEERRYLYFENGKLKAWQE